MTVEKENQIETNNSESIKSLTVFPAKTLKPNLMKRHEPQDLTNEKQCQAFLPSKNRYCKLEAKVGTKYCGEHRMTDLSGAQRRVLCPFNCNSTFGDWAIEKHVKFQCPFRPRSDLVYYSLDTNANNGVAEKVAENFNLTQYRMTMAEFENISTKIQEIYHKQLGTPQFETSIKTHPALKDHHCQVGKHSFQISSLLGHLRDLDLLNENYSFQEWGCGKAEMTRWIYDVVTPKDCLLIDRSQGKLKLNHKHKENQYQRILIDIKDLKLENVPRALERPCIAYSKHLCGSATDMTLRCLHEFRLQGGDLKGICIALCCHQVCTFERYINPHYLARIGIDRQDFKALRKVSTWKIAGKGTKEEHWTGWDLDQRQQLGDLAKRILDYGRLEYVLSVMNAKKAELVYYIDEEKTLENMALMCTF